MTPFRCCSTICLISFTPIWTTSFSDAYRLWTSSEMSTAASETLDSMDFGLKPAVFLAGLLKSLSDLRLSSFDRRTARAAYFWSSYYRTFACMTSCYATLNFYRLSSKSSLFVLTSCFVASNCLISSSFLDLSLSSLACVSFRLVDSSLMSFTMTWLMDLNWRVATSEWI